MDTATTLDVTDRLPDGLWSVDPEQSEVAFAVKAMWGLATVRGVFGAYQGSLNVRSGSATGALKIEAASLDTQNRRRDRHLRSPDFFDVERHPEIVFTAAALTPRPDGLTVAGELAVGASRVWLDLPVTVEQVADGARRLEGEITISRSSAGMTWNMLGTIGEDARLHARLTLEPAAP
jgi:polyisoprenoid-binding protein YceI